MNPRPSRSKTEYVEGLMESLRASPREADLWMHVGDVLLEAGQFEKGVKAYDMALSIDPGLHRAQIGLTVALDLCDGDISGRPAPRVRSTMWEVLQVLETLVRGLRAGRRGLFVDVHALRLQKATERRLADNPDDPDALFLRSAFLAKQGRFEEAVDCLDRLCRRTENHPGAGKFRRQLKQMISASAPRVARPRT